MNIAELSVKKKIITLGLTAVITIGGLIAYRDLPRLEDPDFTIRDAKIETSYPGASAEEVEDEVTNELEKACQELGQLRWVKSISQRNLSIVTPTIKDKYGKEELPQVWDELRQKVSDYQRNLPPGCKASLVNNNFGDVYGTLYAFTGNGYSMAELKAEAKLLQRELLLEKDVKKVMLYGVIDEAIFVEMNRAKMANLQISPNEIYAVLKEKNLVADAGHVKIGPDFIPIVPTGGITTFEDLYHILIKRGTSGQLIYLKDVANIKREYVDPPKAMMFFNGKPAIGIGISTVMGGNVVKMGEAVEERLKELDPEIPAGMKLHPVNLQAKSVVKSVNNFVVHLLEAILIVIIVLLLFMGVRSGLLIGTILVITVAGTFCLMGYYEITLQRISLGALVIALGMLVDNTIIITDGALIRIQGGMDRLKAVKEVVGQTMTPLLLATVIAIIAFASIALSKDVTGEYCGTLFYVLLYSLGFSWVTAVTVTPLFCVMFLKPSNKQDEGRVKDPYDNFFYNSYRKFLRLAIKLRWLTCIILAAMLVASFLGLKKVDKSFFPDSTRNQFMIELWMPYGTYIKDTAGKMQEMEKYLLKIKGVNSVSSFIGQGAPRFIRTYTPEDQDTGYAFALVEVEPDADTGAIFKKIETFTEQDSNFWETKKFRLGPGAGGKYQCRISGRDGMVLDRLAHKVMNIMEDDGQIQEIRSDWRQKVKILTPIFAPLQARNNGIEYRDFAKALQEGFEGKHIGVFREEDNLISIIARAPDQDRNDVKHIENLQIWSPAAHKMIPLRQIISKIDVSWEFPKIVRRNRRPTITLHANPTPGVAKSVPFERIKKKIDALQLPPGYFIEWGGDYENSNFARAGLRASFPLLGILIVLILLVLFNNLRQPLIILLTVPLAVLGVLVVKQPFGFIALLGVMSITGLLIKNAILLISEINVQLATGKDPFDAILNSAVSRVRPVAIVAATILLGMIPLLQDAFFVSMAVTIMSGVTFVSVLTLVVVPVLYAIFYKVHESEAA